MLGLRQLFKATKRALCGPLTDEGVATIDDIRIDTEQQLHHLQSHSPANRGHQSAFVGCHKEAPYGRGGDPLCHVRREYEK